VGETALADGCSAGFCSGAAFWSTLADQHPICPATALQKTTALQRPPPAAGDGVDVSAGSRAYQLGLIFKDLAIDSPQLLWLVSRVRPSRILLTAVVVASVAAGGFFGLQRATADPGWTTGGLREVRGGSLMMAAQPRPGAASAGPSAIPTATPSPSSSPKKTPTPAPSTPQAQPTTKKPTAPPADGTVVQQLLAQINQLRAQNGASALTLSQGLIRSAHKHNLKMMGSCGMQHQCPGEASLGDRISAEGVQWNACGENIGWSGPHPNTNAALVGAAEGLTTSMYNEKPPDDGHRRNLLSTSFHHIGIDVVRDSSGKVWLTQDFSN
jgi:uncharacterized protein YkwD